MYDNGTTLYGANTGTLNATLTAVSSFFSVAGALCIIISFVALQKGRSMSKYIVVAMAFSDISVSLPAFISSAALLGHVPSISINNTYTCKTQAFFITTGSQSSFIWTAGLAQHMYFLISYSKQTIKSGVGVLLFLTVFVVCLNIYAVFYGILGSSQAVGLQWCWIHILEDGENCHWMLWDGKLLEITMYVTVFIYYTLLYIKLKKIKKLNDIVSTGVMHIIAKTGKIIAIPFVFILFRLSGTLVTMWFIHNGCRGRPSSNGFGILLTAVAFLDVAQGWVNCILYFITTGNEHTVSHKLALFVRSIPYMYKTRRPHSSENSCLTYNVSKNGQSRTTVSQNSSGVRISAPHSLNTSPLVKRGAVYTIPGPKDRLITV